MGYPDWEPPGIIKTGGGGGGLKIVPEGVEHKQWESEHEPSATKDALVVAYVETLAAGTTLKVKVDGIVVAESRSVVSEKLFITFAVGKGKKWEGVGSVVFSNSYNTFLD